MVARPLFFFGFKQILALLKLQSCRAHGAFILHLFLQKIHARKERTGKLYVHISMFVCKKAAVAAQTHAALTLQTSRVHHAPAVNAALLYNFFAFHHELLACWVHREKERKKMHRDAFSCVSKTQGQKPASSIDKIDTTHPLTSLPPAHSSFPPLRHYHPTSIPS